MRKLRFKPMLGLSLGLLVCTAACSRQEATSSSGTSSTQQTSGEASKDSAGASIGGTTSPKEGGPMKFERQPVTSLDEILNATNAEAFWTRTVDLPNVTIQRVFASKQFMLIGPNSNQTVLVRLDQWKPELKPGQQVEVIGVIDPLGRDKTQWNVGAEEEQVMQQHTIFISGSQIRSNPAQQ